MIENVLGSAVVAALAITVIGRVWSRSAAEGTLTKWRKESLSGALLAALAAVSIVAVGNVLNSSLHDRVFSLTFFLGLVTSICTWQVDVFVKRWEAATFREAATRAVRSWGAFVRTVVAELWRNITSRNWSELRPGEFTAKRLEGFRGFFGLYVVLFFAMVVIVIVGLTSSALMSPDPSAAFLVAAGSLNAVLIAAHAVLAVLAVVMLLVLARLTDVLKVPLSMGHAFRGGAEAVGWGTAVGALFGALMPLLLTVEPMAPIFQVAPYGRSIYEPSIIVELSAIGAIGGLFVGAAMIPSLLLRSAENLLIRRMLVPLLYAVAIWGTSRGLMPIGRTGEQLLDINRPTLGVEGVQCDQAPPGGLDLTSQSIAMELVHRCDGDLILPDSAVCWGMIPLVLCIAAVLVADDLKRKAAVS